MQCEDTPVLWTARAPPSNSSLNATNTVGWSCADYQSRRLCTIDGGYGPGWDFRDGLFADWARDGVDATQACCVCGGGREIVGSGVCLSCISVGPSTVSGDGVECVSCSAGFQPNAAQSACEECGPGRTSLLGAECRGCESG